MSDPNNFDLELESLKEAATDKWLMQQSLDIAAFDNLYACLSAKSEAVKTEYVVSKQMLRTILDAFNALEDAGKSAQAQKFMVLLGLISRNEAASDRKPGIPRVL